MDKRELYTILLEDPRRQVRVNGYVSHCEGQGYLKHKCQGGLDMNEVLITKRVFQKLSKKKKDYFIHEYNCSLNCRHFHQMAGHSRGFRRWFLQHVSAIYGGANVALWIGNAPLKIKRVN